MKLLAVLSTTALLQCANAACTTETAGITPGCFQEFVHSTTDGKCTAGANAFELALNVDGKCNQVGDGGSFYQLMCSTNSAGEDQLVGVSQCDSNDCSNCTLNAGDIQDAKLDGSCYTGPLNPDKSLLGITIKGTCSTYTDQGKPGAVQDASVTVTTKYDIAAGATTFPLADVTGISVGDKLAIGSGTTKETAVVKAVTSCGTLENPCADMPTVDDPGKRSRRGATAGTVTLAAPLANSHAAGTSITWTPAVTEIITASSAVIKTVGVGVGIFAIVATLF